jgi:recombinational DNA repair protein RecT
MPKKPISSISVVVLEHNTANHASIFEEQFSYKDEHSFQRTVEILKRITAFMSSIELSQVQTESILWALSDVEAKLKKSAKSSQGDADFYR